MNFIFTPGPAGLQSTNVTSEDVNFPVRNTALLTRPRRAWHATSTTTQNLDYYTVSARALFINRPTVSAMRVFRHDGSAWGRTGAQVLDASRRFRTTDTSGSPQAPWATGTGSITVTRITQPAIYPQWGTSTDHIVAGGASASVRQAVAGGVGGSLGKHTFGIWARQSPSAPSVTVGISIQLDAAATTMTTFTPTDDWDYYAVSDTLGAGTTVNFGIHLQANQGVCVGHTQAAVGTLATRLADYESTPQGIVLPTDELRGRRQCVYDLGDDWVVGQQLRVQLAGGQTVDTGEAFYSVGAVAEMATLPFFPGRFSPSRRSISEPHKRVQYPSGAEDVLTLSPDTAILWEYDTDFQLSADFRETLSQLRAQGPAGVSFLWEYHREPGAHRLAKPRTERCGLVRRVSNLAISHQIPELSVLGFGFQEVV